MFTAPLGLMSPKVEVGDIFTITTDQSVLTTVGINFTFTGTITVDWGDGSASENFVSGVEKLHNYLSTGNYAIEITGDTGDITEMVANSNRITSIDNLKTGLLINLQVADNLLTELDLQNAPISGLFYTFSNPLLTNIVFASSGNGVLTDIRMYQCAIIIVDFQNLFIDAFVRIYDNYTIESVLFSATNGEMKMFSAGNNLLPNIDFSSFATSDGKLVKLIGNGFTATEHDNQLINLDATGWVNNSLIILSGNTARTSASDAAYNNLIAKGWTIT